MHVRHRCFPTVLHGRGSRRKQGWSSEYSKSLSLNLFFCISIALVCRSHIRTARTASQCTVWRAVVRTPTYPLHPTLLTCFTVGVAGSAIKWLRDSMYMVQSAADVNTLAAKVPDTGGLYFVTAFGGLFAPYWDPSATGLIIGASSCRVIECIWRTDSRRLIVKACRRTPPQRTSPARLWRRTHS